MIIDFGATIHNIKGEPMEDETGPVTLGRITTNALLADYPDEHDQRGASTLNGEQKAKRFKLALLATTEAPADVSVEDMAEIKKLVPKAYGPLVVGRVFDILEANKVVKLVQPNE